MADFLLENRAALRRDFYALTGTSADDDGLNEYDVAANERVHRHIQAGLWDAQEYVLAHADPERWLSTSPALSFTTQADGSQRAALPSDFLRLAGDEKQSALWHGNGVRWGNLVDASRRTRAYGSQYWLQGEYLYVARGGSPPSGLVMDYHHRHAVLEDDTTALDFPVTDRSLIVAFAADHAKHEAWLPGGPEMLAKIQNNLGQRKLDAWRRARRTRSPQRRHAPDVTGSHWFV